jgi:DNA phosphorothioation-associated putative methyltransferase
VNSKEYKALLDGLGVGKKLPNTIYLHKSAVQYTPDDLKNVITNVSRALKIESSWNVVKLHQDDFKISYLTYPNFDEDPYPCLSGTTIVNLETKSMEQRSYNNQTNPPILHRKETLVTENYPLYEEFGLITQEGESAGLYDEASNIGHKQSWEFKIRQRGYQLVDGRLFRQSALDVNTDVINRERTAITRFHLSAPFQAVGKLGYLDGRFSILVYCPIQIIFMIE